MKAEKKDILLRNCRVEDFVILEKIAIDNNCSVARAFDLVMDYLKKSKVKLTREMKASKK